MAADKTLFAPVPMRAMAADLSGLQLRVLVCVAAHDRMSLAVGKGQGCRSSNERMSQLIGCSYARVCSTLSELVDLEFLSREKSGRYTVYRVVYSDFDRLLFSNVLGAAKGALSASRHGSIGCRAVPETGGNQPDIGSQYIPLNGEIDLEESREDSSSEEARFAARELSKMEFENNVGAQLAAFERAWKASPQRYSVEALEKWATYCEEAQEAFELGDPEYGQAQRLAYEIDDHIDLLRNGRLLPATSA